MSIYLRRGTSRRHLSEVPLDFFIRRNKNGQRGKDASLSDAHEEGGRPTAIKGKKNALPFFAKPSGETINMGREKMSARGYAPAKGKKKKIAGRGKQKAASANACLEGKILTIVGYDFVEVLREVRRAEVFNEAIPKVCAEVSSEERGEATPKMRGEATPKMRGGTPPEAVSPPGRARSGHTLPRSSPGERETSLLLRQIEGETMPTENPLEKVTKWEVTTCWQKHKKINIAFVERRKRKNGKTVWARKVKKIYLCPKESTFSPLLDKYVRYEDVVKLERHLTRHLAHKNIIVMESFFHVNDEVVSVYPFGGVSLMRWNTREKLFQLQCMEGGRRSSSRRRSRAGSSHRSAGRNALYAAGGMAPHTPLGEQLHEAVHTIAAAKKTKRTYVYPEYLLAEIIRQLLTACHYLNEQHIFHSDIKPSNIVVKNVKKKNMNKIYFCRREKKWYLQKMGRILKKKIFVKLIDFEHAQKTSQGKVNVGGTTSLFKPLEDFQMGRINALPKNVWALGITLFILSTGAHPFSRINNDMHIWYVLQGKGFDVCRRFRRYPFMSSSLKDLLARMLQVDFARRATLPELFLHPFVLFGGAVEWRSGEAVKR
ncbi:serine/threonine protein kinase, putative [Plasmodium vivax]|nr:serine/threonine protein kinase, putative [Plasmodium vivax]